MNYEHHRLDWQGKPSPQGRLESSSGQTISKRRLEIVGIGGDGIPIISRGTKRLETSERHVGCAG